MANFCELSERLAAGKIPKLVWVCGDQPVLREEAVRLVRRSLGVGEVSVHVAEAKKSNAAIWTDMSQHAIDPKTRRLIIVRDAEKLGKSLAKLEGWLGGARYAEIYVVMVSEAAEWRKDFASEARKKVVGSSLSLYVEARLPKSPGDARRDPKDERGVPYGKAEIAAARIAGEWCGDLLSEELRLRLVRRTNVDLARVRDVCWWVRALMASDGGWRVSGGVIDALAAQRVGEGFVEALSRLDKASAMRWAGEMGKEEVRPCLYRLARCLSNLEAANKALRPALAKYASEGSRSLAVRREVAKVARVSDAEVNKYFECLKHYGSAEVGRRIEALIRADERHREVGVLEALVSEW